MGNRRRKRLILVARAIRAAGCDRSRRRGPPASGSRYRLVNVMSGLCLRALCLDDGGGVGTAGNPMRLWSCNALSPRIWHLEPR